MKCFPSRGCGIWAVRRGANRRSGCRVGKPITCWGLGRARRGAGPGQGQGQRQRAARGAQPPPSFLRDRPAGGRADAGTQAPRDGAARRWNAVFSGGRDFAPEWRTVRGGVSHGPLPAPRPPPRAPFQALSGSLQNCALKFKERRAACAAGGGTMEENESQKCEPCLPHSADGGQKQGK